MSVISKGNVLHYYLNFGSLRYGNEYCVPGRAINCTARLLPSKKSELQWLERLIIYSDILGGYGGLNSHWLARHHRGLVIFLILDEPINVQL